MRPTTILRIFLWLSVLVLGTKLTHSVTIRGYGSSVDDFYEVPLDEAASILNYTKYNASLCSRFYAFGYEMKADGTSAKMVISALLLPSHEKCNVFLLNWEKEAAGIELNTLTQVLTYPEVVLYQVSAVGIEFGSALTKMAYAGLDLNRAHLIGHSLGAHLCGFTGRKLLESNMTIDRITGLDPAGPFFQVPPLMIPLDKNCAKFVDCVHTDYGVYGINKSLCHTDTYIFKLEENVQPGCPIGLFLPLSSKSTCSHNRVWSAYSDSLYHPNTLIGSYAENFGQWLGCEGDDQNQLAVGINVDRSKSGNFFIWHTNSSPPYGQGQAGIKPSYCSN